MSKEEKVLFIPSEPNLTAYEMKSFRDLMVKSMIEMSGVPGRYLNNPEDMKLIGGVESGSIVKKHYGIPE